MGSVKTDEQLEEIAGVKIPPAAAEVADSTIRLKDAEDTLFRLIDEYHASLKQPDARQAVIGAALELGAATQAQSAALKKSNQKE